MVFSAREQFSEMGDNLGENDLLTLREASVLEECDIKPVSLRAAINKGQLPGKKIGTTWVIKYSDLALYLDNRKVGRPKKGN